MPSALDGLWRPEERPEGSGRWLLARYTADLGRPVREVYREDGYAPHFDSEEEAEQVADTLNPPPGEGRVPRPLSDADLALLLDIAGWPEGAARPTDDRHLISLEHRGLLASSAYDTKLPGLDRWKITPAGLAALKGRIL